MDVIIAITDRTQSDIDQRTEKAYINANDLNRVWKNAAIAGACYGLDWPVTEYVAGDLPRNANWKSLSDAMQTLRNACLLAGAPEVPIYPQVDWMAWNTLEKIPLAVYNYFNIAVSAFPRCGEICAGDQIGVI